MSNISERGAATIASRKAKARPKQLAEIVQVVRSRGGAVSQEQIFVIGCITSYLIAPADWAANLRELLVLHAGADPDIISRWLSSAAAGRIASHIAASERGERKVYRRGHLEQWVDPREDYSNDSIIRIFDIDQQTVENLNLTQLVSNQQRKEAARRAEGIPTKAELRAKHSGPKPHEMAGVSESTYKRRQAKQKALADTWAMALALTKGGNCVTEDATLSSGTSETAKEAGQGGSSHSVSPTGRAAPSFILDTVVGQFAGIQPKRAPSMQPGELVSPLALPRKDVATGTAEARRFAKMAGELGCVWSAHKEDGRPSTWFYLPEGRALTAEDLLALRKAALAADQAAERSHATAVAKSRRLAKEKANNGERSADDRTFPPAADQRAERRASDLRGDRIPGVSQSVWDLVPHHVRGRIRKPAARIYAQGWYTKDEAIRMALPEVLVPPDYDGLVLAEVTRLAPNLDLNVVREWLYLGEVWNAEEVLERVEREKQERLTIKRAKELVLAGFDPAHKRPALIRKVYHLLRNWPDMKTDKVMALARLDLDRDLRAGIGFTGESD